MDALATYQYLTTGQMVRLGLGSSRGHVIERVLKGLRRETSEGTLQRKQRLVGRLAFGSVIGKGRLSDLYYLTNAGATIVAQRHRVRQDQLRYPSSKPQFKRDYFHRVAFVDTHIALVIWAKQRQLSITTFDRYFDNQPKGMPSTLTRQGHIRLIPDGRFIVRNSVQKAHRYFIEVHLGHRPAEVIRQLSQYVGLLDKTTSLISLFENKTTLQSVKATVQCEEYASHIHFLTLNQLVAGWLRSDS